MAQQARKMRFVADDGETLEVLPDSRDLFRLRGEVEKRHWPENMSEDAIRQSYLLGWLALGRTGQLPPGQGPGGGQHFNEFVEMWAMEFPEQEDAQFTHSPTPPGPSDT